MPTERLQCRDKISGSLMTFTFLRRNLQVMHADVRFGAASALLALVLATSTCVSDDPPASETSDLATATWPYEILDRAETARAAGDDTSARQAYRQLVEWAASDPLNDGWGGTALAPYSLWRWSQYAGGADSPDPEEVDAMLAAERNLRHAKLPAAVFSGTLLDTLPQLQEANLLTLALLAQRAGRHDAARPLFLDYLTVTRDDALTVDAEALRRRLVADGWATSDAIDLLRAHRLRELRHFDQAEDLFARLTDSAQEAVRQEARLNLAELRFATHDDNLSAQMRREVTDVLSQTVAEARDPILIQRAYYQRGRVQRREGAAQSIDGFTSNMETLIREFPTGEYAAEALYELAQYSEAQYRLTHADEWMTSALDYYARMRELPGPHAREDSMYFRPALALYTRSLVNDTTAQTDLAEADELLSVLARSRPSGPLHLASLLWLARIAEARGDQERATGLYERLVETDPFGYYGIRGLMHLDPQADATTQLFPSGRAHDRLARSIAMTAPGAVAAATHYHERLRHAVESGRYSAALESLKRFRARASASLRTARLSDLEDGGELDRLVFLLAIRQDAVAARDTDRRPDNVVQIAASVGHGTNDWPLALTLLLNRGGSRADGVAVKRHESYVPVAYPRVWLERFAAVAAEYDVMPSLLYGIARRESFFDAAAVSALGAVGLFQFMPSTFGTLDRRWGLQEAADTSSWQEYLHDERRSIMLAGRYVREELLNRYPLEQGLLFALMDHSGGASAVRSWREEWERIGRANDVEYMIETARFVETRILLRGIIVDIAVAEAAGLFNDVRAEG